MTEEILKRLDALADKLQTTVQHLYGVMLQQAVISKYIDGFWLLVSIGLFIWGWLYAVQGTKLKDKWYDVSTKGVFQIVVGSIVACTAIIVFTWNTWEFFTSVFNPEYLVLYQLGQLFHN